MNIAVNIVEPRLAGIKVTDDEITLDIQRQICASMPPGVCKPEPGENYQPLNDLSRRLTLEKIEAFSF